MQQSTMTFEIVGRIEQHLGAVVGRLLLLEIHVRAHEGQAKPSYFFHTLVGEGLQEAESHCQL